MAQLVGASSHAPKVLWVQILVRAHTKVAGLMPMRGACGKLPMDVSLSHQCFSLSLPLPL